MSPDLARAIVAHHLRLFGVANAGDEARANSTVRLRCGSLDAAEIRRLAAAGNVVVALSPDAASCSALGVEAKAAVITSGSAVLTYMPEVGLPRSRLRTLHSYKTFSGPISTIVADCAGRPVWAWLPLEPGGALFVGTDLAADLVRYRQGDPALSIERAGAAIWGFEFERPVYLFEDQLAGEAPHERHADWWAMALASSLAAFAGCQLRPILPGGAVGAIIITGDDDQAYLEKYSEQLKLLGEAPITYFLHPQTRHTRETVNGMLGRSTIDLGLHPDALDAPERYSERVAQQAAWFHELTGEAPISVRNHGFLNDGYWGHLASWRSSGIRISSNLPGLDGRVLNGSLLPARLAFDGVLSEHWSLLTAIGDGIAFVDGRISDEAAAAYVLTAARRIVESGVAGVLVLNLHPQNVSEARSMHEAALEVIASGFHAWTLRECLAWFEERDGAGRVVPHRPPHLSHRRGPLELIARAAREFLGW